MLNKHKKLIPRAMRKLFKYLTPCIPVSISYIQLAGENSLTTSTDVNESREIVRFNDYSIQLEEPEGFISELKNHQKIGLDWLVKRETVVPELLDHPEHDF